LQFKSAEVKSCASSAAPGAPSSSHPKKAKDVRKFRPSLGVERLNWVKKFDDGDIKVIPGAKLTAVMKKLEEWKREAPKDKVIVFTQWKSLLVMLASFLEKKKIKFVYFTVGLYSLYSYTR
jgi:SNF2 family DNA or RNA helicase